MYNLAVDIGNTRVKVGLFARHELVSSSIHSRFDEQVFRNIDREYTVSNLIISSVRAESSDPAEFRVPGKMMRLSYQTHVPLVIDYETPSTLGNDRIAGAVAVSREFGGKSVFVVDAGTCITYDLVTSTGVFKGGNIAPGVEMRLRAMNEFTGRLPHVSKGPVANLLGRSTGEALLNGAVQGVLLEIEGYINRLSERFSDLCVVFTGGDAAYLAESVKTEIFVRPNLVLFGLNEILQFNVEQ